MSNIINKIFQDTGLTTCDSTITGSSLGNYTVISSSLITKRDLDDAKEEIIGRVLEGIREDQCENCDCNKSCDRTEPCEYYGETPLDAMLYGCDLKGIYINDKNGTITCVNTDGETFSAKISGSDEFDPRIGVALVLAYNFMGSKGSFNNAVKELMNSKRFHITKKVKEEKKETKEDAKENK